ncbi:hypothetical protein ACFP2T_07440 [Plantactinospora solaniradicis]|uniref:Uncharacterized protein n=1 Tax=Plantactinospora solaniradicis TaxID=1723736 RepID=A0ABW1K3H8_9ACTN
MDAHSVAMVALRGPNLVPASVDADLVVMGMLVDSRDELGPHTDSGRQPVAPVVVGPFPRWAKQFLSARQPRALIAIIRPRDIVGKTRRRLAVELIGEFESTDKNRPGNARRSIMVDGDRRVG